MLNLKLADNLFLEGLKVISYKTHVGTIEAESIAAKGKFSITTTKHLSKAASFLGLRIISSDDRPSFYKYNYGTKFYLDDCLSPKISHYIIQFLNKNSINYMDVSSELIEPILFNIPFIGKKDWEILRCYLNLPPDAKTPQQKDRDAFNVIKILL